MELPVNMLYIWLVLMGLLVIAELLTISLTTIWFAGGALAAAITAGIGLPFYVQFGVFIGVSFLLLALMRPIAVRVQRQEKKIPTNADSLIGQEAVVKEQIDNLHSTGSVMINGQEWTARSEQENLTIDPGSTVCIRSISGVKLIVLPAEICKKKGTQV